MFQFGYLLRLQDNLVKGALLFSKYRANEKAGEVIRLTPFRNVMNLSIDMDSSVSRVLKNGSTTTPDGSTIAVEPGDMVIFTWRK